MGVPFRPPAGRAIAAAQKKIQFLDGKISALIDVTAESEPESSGAYRRKVAAYEAQRAALVSEVVQMQASRSRASQAAQITPEAVRGMLTTVLREIREQPTEQQRLPSQRSCTRSNSTPTPSLAGCITGLKVGTR